MNYRGKTSDTGEYYTEVVARFVLDNIDAFKTGIPMIAREKPYMSLKRNGEFRTESNRIEEITAMKMFNKSHLGQEYGFIGKIIDYQTPLKSKRGDVAGKVSLRRPDPLVPDVEGEIGSGKPRDDTPSDENRQQRPLPFESGKFKIKTASPEP